MADVADVIVVGCGLAGLECARALQKSHPDISVLILEARDRIGGRVSTEPGWRIDGAAAAVAAAAVSRPNPPVSTISLPRGALWIHGATKKNPLRYLVHDLGLPLRPKTRFDDGELFKIVEDAGHAVDPDAVAWCAEMTDSVHQRALNLRGRLRKGEDSSLGAAFEEALAKAGATPAVKADARWDAGLVRFIEETWWVDDYAGDLDALSLRYCDADDEFQVDYDRVLAGDGQAMMLEALAKGLDVRLSTPVSRIGWRPPDGDPNQPAATITADGKTFSAHVGVVCAVPLGVLKQPGGLEFVPSLPAEKLRAIDRLGVGHFTKVTLQFAAPFWNPESHTLRFHDTSSPFRVCINLDLIFPGIAALEFMATGTHGQKLERKVATEGSAAAIEAAMSLLRKCFGAMVTPPTRTSVTGWSTDPYSNGAYSYQAAGSYPTDRKALAATCGSLFFAGEATRSDFYATMHGALMSGRTAAKEVGEALSQA